eukprot:gene11044-3113_t
MSDVDDWENLYEEGDLEEGESAEKLEHYDEEPDEVYIPDPEIESLPEKYRTLSDTKSMMKAIIELHKQLSAAPKAPTHEKKSKSPLSAPPTETQDLSHDELEALKIAQKREQELSELNEIQNAYCDEKAILIDSFQPATKEDFIKFKDALVGKISIFHRSPHYKNEYFIDDLFKGLCQEVNSKRIRSIATNLRKFAEAKDAKDQEKNNKPKKKQLAKATKAEFDGFGKLDPGSYEDEYDFM